ncbi:hypothetical protein [Sphingomonas rubra]|uniref:Uncharacterized protein n=1 Tax=Sphingomonas rubra TaxID=634430 RepID=A0A1I5UHR4_9SPHN|nr:hypothetical protein [Sphingomonas rubra]SFP94146.1 hypothetical protein SAMN04488241_111150 [Sphingomonas rubra]
MRGRVRAGALATVAAALAAGATATPAAAQFYYQSHSYAGEAVRGDEPGITQPLPGATPEEMQAGLVWTLRSALNVAALQCQFEPTLLTVGNYNAILLDHRDELKKAWDTLGKYFKRTNKTPREAQNALDQFGTRTYSSFATVVSQFGFCQTANAIGRDALFQPRGSLATLASTRMRELRNSLKPYGDERFAPRGLTYENANVPRMDPICWNKKGEWQIKKCGTPNWPPVALIPAPAAAAVTAKVASAQ